ncbi:hypothetical protein ILUMI_19361 [Ignelater luminosus]|uniref:Cytochrome c oxidase assembly protein COX20, mitochondrial n=1 Tax=Ignelater luminosus TaxID=2038154 RepID=A0A8K0G3B0_IGNLU|nr:hypothetical protein ILUMI_19361 [Ignelater luminosus]
MTGPSSEKGIVIFGRDITKIPCFRNSFLYGICGGITCGLARFMFTSRVKSATDFAVASFAVITMGYWFQCRYEYSKTKFEMDKMKYLLQNHMMYEGMNKEEANSIDDNKLEDV